MTKTIPCAAASADQPLPPSAIDRREPGEPDAEVRRFVAGDLAGSLIGGIRATQEMLELCAAHLTVSDVASIPVNAVNAVNAVNVVNGAYERMLRGDVRYRCVIGIDDGRGDWARSQA